jgi:hypothetical protein
MRAHTLRSLLASLVLIAAAAPAAAEPYAAPSPPASLLILQT